MSRLSARGDVLFPLGEDIGETNNLIDEHPEKAEPLRKKKAAFEAEFRIARRSVGVGETDGGTPAVAEIQETAKAEGLENRYRRLRSLVELSLHPREK